MDAVSESDAPVRDDAFSRVSAVSRKGKGRGKVARKAEPVPISSDVSVDKQPSESAGASVAVEGTLQSDVPGDNHEVHREAQSLGSATDEVVASVLKSQDEDSAQVKKEEDASQVKKEEDEEMKSEDEKIEVKCEPLPVATEDNGLCSVVDRISSGSPEQDSGNTMDVDEAIAPSSETVSVSAPPLEPDVAADSEGPAAKRAKTGADGADNREGATSPLVPESDHAETVRAAAQAQPEASQNAAKMEKVQVLEELPISRLKSIAKFHSVSLQGCLEKQDIVAALRRKGINDTEVEKEKKAEADREKRARASAAEKEDGPVKTTPTSTSKLSATAGRERTLKENVAKAWAFVIDAHSNNKEKLLNWRPGRRKEEEEVVAEELPHVEIPPPSPPEDGPQVVCPPVRPKAAPKAKPESTPNDPWNTVNLGSVQEILNTHPNVHQDLCWNFMKGGCAKGTRCNWRHPAY